MAGSVVNIRATSTPPWSSAWRVSAAAGLEGHELREPGAVDVRQPGQAVAPARALRRAAEREVVGDGGEIAQAAHAEAFGGVAGDDERVGVLRRRGGEDRDGQGGDGPDERVVRRDDVIARLGGTEAVELGGGAGVLGHELDEPDRERRGDELPRSERERSHDREPRRLEPLGVHLGQRDALGEVERPHRDGIVGERRGRRRVRLVTAAPGEGERAEDDDGDRGSEACPGRAR